MKATIPGIDKPGVFLAPSASASRGTLREKGFHNADTIARFLTDQRFREQARGGFIYIDEAPLAGLSDIDAVFAPRGGTERTGGAARRPQAAQERPARQPV